MQTGFVDVTGGDTQDPGLPDLFAHVECRAAVLRCRVESVYNIQAAAFFEKKFNSLCVPTLGRHVQGRRLVPEVTPIHVSSPAG